MNLPRQSKVRLYDEMLSLVRVNRHDILLIVFRKGIYHEGTRVRIMSKKEQETHIGFKHTKRHIIVNCLLVLTPSYPSIGVCYCFPVTGDHS
jgi:hypothetical protein